MRLRPYTCVMIYHSRYDDVDAIILILSNVERNLNMLVRILFVTVLVLSIGYTPDTGRYAHFAVTLF